MGPWKTNILTFPVFYLHHQSGFSGRTQEERDSGCSRGEHFIPKIREVTPSGSTSIQALETQNSNQTKQQQSEKKYMCGLTPVAKQGHLTCFEGIKRYYIHYNSFRTVVLSVVSAMHDDVIGDIRHTPSHPTRICRIVCWNFIGAALILKLRRL